MLVTGLSDIGKFLFARSGAAIQLYRSNANIFLKTDCGKQNSHHWRDDTLHTQWILLVFLSVLSVANENGKQTKKKIIRYLY